MDYNDRDIQSAAEFSNSMGLVRIGWIWPTSRSHAGLCADEKLGLLGSSATRRTAIDQQIQKHIHVCVHTLFFLTSREAKESYSGVSGKIFYTLTRVVQGLLGTFSVGLVSSTAPASSRPLACSVARGVLHIPPYDI